MIHYGTINEIGGEHHRITKAWMDHELYVNKVMEQIYLERIRERHPTFALKQLQTKLQFDTILTAMQAVEIGLADAVI